MGNVDEICFKFRLEPPEHTLAYLLDFVIVFHGCNAASIAEWKMLSMLQGKRAVFQMMEQPVGVLRDKIRCKSHSPI